MEALQGIGSYQKLSDAFNSLLHILQSRGLPPEFWTEVDRIRSKRVMDIEDYELVVELVNAYEKKMGRTRRRKND